MLLQSERYDDITVVKVQPNQSTAKSSAVNGTMIYAGIVELRLLFFMLQTPTLQECPTTITTTMTNKKQQQQQCSNINNINNVNKDTNLTRYARLRHSL